MAFAPQSEVKEHDLKVGQWVTVIGEAECGKPHIAYVSNYDKDLDLWFFMVEGDVISE